MFQDHGPYRKHYLGNPNDADYIEIRWPPDGWKPILQPTSKKTKVATAIATAFAAGAWALVAASAVTTFAH